MEYYGVTLSYLYVAQYACFCAGSTNSNYYVTTLTQDADKWVDVKFGLMLQQLWTTALKILAIQPLSRCSTETVSPIFFLTARMDANLFWTTVLRN